jgi:hypothetical protein
MYDEFTMRSRRPNQRPFAPQTKTRLSGSRHLTPLWRAVVETGFIIFLFYSNLLMGEFTATNSHGKTLALALADIFTLANFAIALVCALIGYLVFEFLRKKL